MFRTFLYAADEGLNGWNILKTENIAMSLYDIVYSIVHQQAICIVWVKLIDKPKE